MERLEYIFVLATEEPDVLISKAIEMVNEDGRY